MSTAKEHYATWPEAIGKFKKQAPEVSMAFGGMFQKLMGDGALSTLEKELLAVAIGMATRCEPCIFAHVEKAVKLGATREQLIELAGVVVMMQGGPGYVYVPKLIDAMEALGI